MARSPKNNAPETPKPGQPVRGSRTGRPVMVLLDLLGRRGALRIIWELRQDALTFRALQDAAELTPSTLNTRLKELRDARIVALGEGGYALTAQGHELRQSLAALTSWAGKYVA